MGSVRGTGLPAVAPGVTHRARPGALRTDGFGENMFSGFPLRREPLFVIVSLSWTLIIFFLQVQIETWGSRPSGTEWAIVL